MQFGIVIPVAGQAQFIGDALRSLQAQRVAYQLAVMDATPGDSVQNVIHAYHDVVSYNRHGPDAGQAAAIAEGWQRIDADILAWLCADDYYFPYTLAEVRHIFETRRDIDIVYGDTVFVDEAGRFLGYFSEISANVSILPKSCCISQPSCFVRRSAIEKVGGLATHLHFVMDWDLWTRLYLAGATFSYLKKPLSVCRMHRGTKTASRSYQRYQEISAHLKRYTTGVTRARSLIGFYYQDLLTQRVSWIDQLAYWTLSRVWRMKRWGRSRGGKQPSVSTLYGFENRTNIVQERGEVWLPWFEETDRCLVRIATDRAIDLHVLLPDGRADVVACKLEGDTYTTSILIEHIQAQLIHFVLQAGEEDPMWQVKTIELHPAGLPDTSPLTTHV